MFSKGRNNIVSFGEVYFEYDLEAKLMAFIK